MMRCAAIAMVCRPDEQKRLMVTPAVVTGRPARSAICARDVAAGGAFGQRAADEHVFDLGRVDAGALDGVPDRVAAERRAVGHVEGALPALGQRRCGRWRR